MRAWGIVVGLSAAGVMLGVTVGVTAQGAASAAAAPQAPGGGGRGPSPGSLLWAERCAGCHGTSSVAGRAPDLFDETWLGRAADPRIADTIKSGVPSSEMPAFGAELTEVQIFQLIQYLRTQTATSHPQPAFVANPHGTVVRSEKQSFRMELVADGLMTPWALAFLPDELLLITERDGRLRIVDHGQLSESVSGAPKPHVQQDGGHLDIELHPDYARNRWIYLAYSEAQPGYVATAEASSPQTPPSMTVIVRGRIDQRNHWTDEQLIYRAPSELYTTNGAHYGCRMIFDRQNHLFFAIGERGRQPNSQDLKTPLGKIHRVNDDGSLPSDNPFVNTPDVVPTI